MVAALAPEMRYSGSKASAQWRGQVVADKDRFRAYVADRVKSRAEDDEAQDSFAAELRGMATTGMATDFVEKLLRAVPEEQAWAVGEALAECVLADDENREVCWPWNLVRDRRTPRASLPGADLVGFCKEGESVLLLFGEVKTSSDTGTPPGVMNGSGGMAWQLEEEATRLFTTRAKARIARDQGVLLPLSSPGELLARPWPAHELARLAQLREDAFVGTADRLGERLRRLARELQVQEIAVVTWTHDLAARMDSYRLLAGEFGLAAA